MIKKYKIGLMVYIFEVKTSVYKTPHKDFGLTPMTQECFIPVEGSVARYNAVGKYTMEPFNEELDFPALECENPMPFELDLYEKLSLV